MRTRCSVLVEFGANLNARSALTTFPEPTWKTEGMATTVFPRGDWTPLMYAARQGSGEGVRALLTIGRRSESDGPGWHDRPGPGHHQRPLRRGGSAVGEGSQSKHRRPDRHGGAVRRDRHECGGVAPQPADSEAVGSTAAHRYRQGAAGARSGPEREAQRAGSAETPHAGRWWARRRHDPAHASGTGCGRPADARAASTQVRIPQQRRRTGRPRCSSPPDCFAMEACPAFRGLRPARSRQ